MRVKGIIEEDFTNYKVPAMFINTCFCDFKCCNELGIDVEVCQNAPLANSPIKKIADEVICEHFVRNPITKAIVVGGMEPFLQYEELDALIGLFREEGINAPFIIYTGYYPEEIQPALSLLKKYKNIIVKFGRYVPDKPHRYDEVLGIELSSDNQFAQQIS